MMPKFAKSLKHGEIKHPGDLEFLWIIQVQFATQTVSQRRQRGASNLEGIRNAKEQVPGLCLKLVNDR